MQGHGGVPARSRDTACEKLGPVVEVEHDRLVPDVPDLPAGARERRELLARLRAAAEAKDAEVVMLRAELTAERELCRRMELRIGELERRLGQDGTNSWAAGYSRGNWGGLTAAARSGNGRCSPACGRQCRSVWLRGVIL
jgi:hypothetical protein